MTNLLADRRWNSWWAKANIIAWNWSKDGGDNRFQKALKPTTSVEGLRKHFLETQVEGTIKKWPKMKMYSPACHCNDFVLRVARYHFFTTDPDPIPKFWVAYLPIRYFIFYTSMCVDQIMIFLCYTQSTKYRQLYCKEKQQMNAYIIIIYDKNTIIN